MKFLFFTLYRYDVVLTLFVMCVYVCAYFSVMNSTMTPVTMATEAEGLSTPASAAGRQFNRIVLAQIMGAVLSVFVRSIELSGLHG